MRRGGLELLGKNVVNISSGVNILAMCSYGTTWCILLPLLFIHATKDMRRAETPLLLVPITPPKIRNTRVKNTEYLLRNTKYKAKNETFNQKYGIPWICDVREVLRVPITPSRPPILRRNPPPLPPKPSSQTSHASKNPPHSCLLLLQLSGNPGRVWAENTSLSIGCNVMSTKSSPKSPTVLSSPLKV